MAASDAASPAALGFLTVLEHEQHGLVGGYLILNAAGRPLEFHCTAPVKPSRAQQILFGRTLQPYLYGEQIGQTLLAKGSLEPLVVCTNVELALSVRPFVDLPVALVLSEWPEQNITEQNMSVQKISEQQIADIRPPASEGPSSSAGQSAGQVFWRCDRPHTWGATSIRFTSDAIIWPCCRIMNKTGGRWNNGSRLWRTST